MLACSVVLAIIAAFVGTQYSSRHAHLHVSRAVNQQFREPALAAANCSRGSLAIQPTAGTAHDHNGLAHDRNALSTY